MIPPSRVFPPVEFCRGTKPSQAANSRPERNTFGSATVVAMAVANSARCARNAFNQHRALTHQLFAAAMQQRRRLLLCRLDRHKSHRRALNRLANRFRIGTSHCDEDHDASMR